MRDFIKALTSEDKNTELPEEYNYYCYTGKIIRIEARKQDGKIR